MTFVIDQVTNEKGTFTIHPPTHVKEISPGEYYCKDFGWRFRQPTDEVSSDQIKGALGRWISVLMEAEYHESLKDYLHALQNRVRRVDNSPHVR